MSGNGLITSLGSMTMSSREIADLMGKRHADVMRDIRTMLEQIGESERKFASAYNDAQGKVRECYNLPKNLTLNLIAGYRADLRLKIIDRWMELEAQIVAESMQARKVERVTLEDVWPKQFADVFELLEEIKGLFSRSPESMAQELAWKQLEYLEIDLRMMFFSQKKSVVRDCIERLKEFERDERKEGILRKGAGYRMEKLGLP